MASIKGLKVLSVASEIYPLVKTGGLADVVGALPAALAAEGVARHDAGARLSGRAGGAGGAARSSTLSLVLFGGDARLLRRRPPASTCWCSMRRISTTGRATPISARDGRDWHDNPLRFAALVARGRRSRSRPASRLTRPTSSTPMTGRPGSRPAYLRYSGRPHAPSGDDRPQPGLPGPVSAATCCRRSACRHTPSRSTASNISARSAS